MGNRDVLSFITRPRGAARATIGKVIAPLHVAGIIAFMAAEAFVMAACIQFWWFGQLYPRSTAWLLFGIMVLSLVPTLHATPREIPGTWLLSAKLLSLPAVASLIIIVTFRLGFVAHIDVYLYRSPLLVTLVLSFMVAFLVLKALYRVPMLARKPRGWRVVLHVAYIIVDMALMVTFALFLINFEALILIFP